MLTNQNSGIAMDVAGASTAAGALVIQWPADGGTNQEWTLQQDGGNIFTVRNVNSGMCLDVPGSSVTEGVQLDQWTCNGGANQIWIVG